MPGRSSGCARSASAAGGWCWSTRAAPRPRRPAQGRADLHPPRHRRVRADGDAAGDLRREARAHVRARAAQRGRCARRRGAPLFRRGGGAASGVPGETIVELARSFATARRATAYCSTGVNQGSAGSLAFLAVQALNARHRPPRQRGRRARPLPRAHPRAHAAPPRSPPPAAPEPHRQVPDGGGLAADRHPRRRDPHPRPRSGARADGGGGKSAPLRARRRAAPRALSSLELWCRSISIATRPARSPTTRCPPPIARARRSAARQPACTPSPTRSSPREWSRRATAPHRVANPGRSRRGLGDPHVRLPGMNAVLRRRRHRPPRSAAPPPLKLTGLPLSARASRAECAFPPSRPARFCARCPRQMERSRRSVRDPRRRCAPGERMKRGSRAPPPLRLIGRRQRRSHNTWFHNLPRLRPDGAECRLSIASARRRARAKSPTAPRSRSPPPRPHPGPRAPRRGRDARHRQPPARLGPPPDAGWRVAARPGENGPTSTSSPPTAPPPSSPYPAWPAITASRSRSGRSTPPTN